jgi:polyisoprenoid-binding protein YceI
MATKAWTIDAAHSGIHFAVRHMVISKVRGSFDGFTATLELDEADLTRSRVAVRIDAASISTKNAQRDAHLRSPDFFDVERFPALTYVSKRVEAAGSDRFRVVGDLTIRDVTREVVLDAELGGLGKDPWGGERAGFTARTTVDRREFGLTWNQLLETGGVLVGDKIEVEIEVEAVAQADRKAA